MAAVLHKDRQLNNLRYCNMWRHLNKFGGGDIQFGARGEVLDGKILVARVTAGQSVYMTEHAQHTPHRAVNLERLAADTNEVTLTAAASRTLVIDFGIPELMTIPDNERVVECCVSAIRKVEGY